MPATNHPPEELLRRLRQGSRFLLTSHLHPDGDAIGSELGLARMLRRMGKSAAVWNRDPAPGVYDPLPGSDRIHVGAEPPAGFPDSFDAAIVLECPSLDRTGLEDALGEVPLLNLDHHLRNQVYGAVNWVDTEAPSVGEMVFRLAHGLGGVLDAETATCLYLTLVTDTGGFRYSNATAAAFEAAAALVREGAQPVQVSEWLFENQPEGAVRLLGEMLPTLERHADGSIATALLTPEMYQRAGAEPGDAEGLIDHPRSIAGVEAVALLRQQDAGRFKVSLRSLAHAPIVSVAERHGGGGHPNAAGCELTGPLDEVRATIVRELREALGR